MSEQRQNNTQAENPEQLLHLKIGRPKVAAAGLPAVLISARHVFGAMDAVRGMKALLALNQKDGYDCPGCAWPDPDDDRSPIAEYCENGAKAIAEEATTRKLIPKFFAENTVKDLSELND